MSKAEIKRMELLRVRLRTRLAYLGTSRSAFARHLGISPAAVYGRLDSQDVRLSQIEEFAQALGVSPRYLTEAGGDAWDELLSPPPAWLRAPKAR